MPYFPLTHSLSGFLPEEPMLTLAGSLIFTPSQCAEVCAANPAAVLELAANLTLIGMTSTGGTTGARKIRLLAQLKN